MKKYLPAIILSLLVLPVPGRSQQPLVGLIQGTIVDQNHVPLPDAALIATDIDSVEAGTNRRTAETDRKGFYQFVDVPMGRYAVIVSKKGYQAHQIPEVKVRGGEKVTLPEIKLSSAASR